MDFLEKPLPLHQRVSEGIQRSEMGHIPVVAEDAGAFKAAGGMIPPDVGLEVVPPLELATTAKKSE